MISRRRFIAQSVFGSGALAIAPLSLLGCKTAGPAPGPTAGGRASAKRLEDLLIGCILGLSGEDSILGRETKEGMEIALEEINSTGGLRGRALKVLYEDTGLDAKVAYEKMQKLVDHDRVLCVIGDAASGPTLGARIYAEKARVPLISGSATNVEVTRNARYVFRVCFDDAAQAAAGAKFAREVLKADKAAILFAAGNKYSEVVHAFFQAEFEKRGGTTVATERYQHGAASVVAALTKIKDSDAQIVYAPVYPLDLLAIGPAKEKLGLKAPLLGTDGWDGPVTRAKGVVETLEGSYFTDIFAAEGPNTSRAFVEQVEKRYGAPPSSLTAGGYDALKLVFDAMGRAKELTSEAIRDAIEQTRNFPGVDGPITIDQGHNGRRPVTIRRISGGDFKYHSRIDV